MVQDFSENILVSLINKKFNDLKEIYKKYPMLKINLDDLEKKVYREIKSQVPDKIRIPVKKIKGQNTEEKEFEKGYFDKNVQDFQMKKFKLEYKKWLQNLIAILNKIKLKNKNLDIKKIVEPFLHLEFSKKSSEERVKSILAKVIMKLSN